MSQTMKFETFVAGQWVPRYQYKASSRCRSITIGYGKTRLSLCCWNKPIGHWAN